MTTTITTIDTTKPRTIGPIKAALGEALAELSQLWMTPNGCPDYPTTVPLPEDHQAVAEFLRKLALINGRLLRKVGMQVRANALCHIEIARFADDTFLDAIEGWATAECESAARAAEDDLEDRIAEGQHRYQSRPGASGIAE